MRNVEVFVRPKKGQDALKRAMVDNLSKCMLEAERYDEEILDLPAVGFIVVCVYSLGLRYKLTHVPIVRTALDIPNKRMTVLSPSQGSLVGRTAVVGSFEWQE